MLTASYVPACLMILAGGFAVWTIIRFVQLLVITAKLARGGYAAPEPSWFGRLFLRVFEWAINTFFNGPIHVIGAENVDIEGRVIIAPNHCHLIDAIAVGRVLPYVPRYIGAHNVVRGVLGFIGAFTGAITVDRGSPRGAALAYHQTVKVFEEHPDMCLVMFPQGRLVYKKDVAEDGRVVVESILELSDFKTGVVRMLRELEEKQPLVPTTILPVAIYHETDRRKASLLRRIFDPYRIPSLRKLTGYGVYGTTVVFGEGITNADLTGTHRQATGQLMDTIDGLLHIAKARTAQLKLS